MKRRPAMPVNRRALSGALLLEVFDVLIEIVSSPPSRVLLEQVGCHRLFPSVQCEWSVETVAVERIYGGGNFLQIHDFAPMEIADPGPDGQGPPTAV